MAGGLLCEPLLALCFIGFRWSIRQWERLTSFFARWKASPNSIRNKFRFWAAWFSEQGYRWQLFWNYKAHMGKVANLELQFYLLQKREQETMQWVADLSHDLKSPLSAIQGYVEIIGFQTEHRDSHSRLPTQALLENSLRMERLIQGLGQYSQLKARRDIPKSAFSLAEMVWDLATQFQTRFQQKGIPIEMSPPSSIFLMEGFPNWMERALQNLFENALQHGDASGPLRIQLQALPGQWRLEFRNSGPEIPAKVRPYLFERYRRGARSDQPGSGLGLAIVKEVMLQHNGYVFYNSPAPGQHSFGLLLPNPA